ncbi:MAG: MBL fold metallo-hydrolase, partial [Thermoplasmata archaeon]|nr:MBL fold metallo-hydrolase [Thermoplasmata archaeon]
MISIKITVVYDNEANPPYKSDWGFACLIERKNAIVMFDTGAQSDILIYNLSKLELIDKQIDAVILSHNHLDHTGGLEGLLALQPDLKIIEPQILKAPTELFPGIMSSGRMGARSLQEQSLFCTVEKGLVVVTGCSHPGLEKILKFAHKFGLIHAVIGGFHGFSNFNALNDISLIVPCHCTSHKHELNIKFPETYQECGVGRTFEFSE